MQWYCGRSMDIYIIWKLIAPPCKVTSGKFKTTRKKNISRYVLAWGFYNNMDLPHCELYLVLHVLHIYILIHDTRYFTVMEGGWKCCYLAHVVFTCTLLGTVCESGFCRFTKILYSIKLFFRPLNKIVLVAHISGIICSYSLNMLPVIYLYANIHW